MRTTPLHALFGVEVHDIDLCHVTADRGYADIRAAFEEHSLLLFRNQSIDDDRHLAFGALFGPIEDRRRGAENLEPAMSVLTNQRDDKTMVPQSDHQVLNLKANQLWHTDSTFLPAPALANILAARTVTTTGGETEFVSTRAAWRDMPEALKARIRGKVIRHRYAHSRAKVSPKLATDDLFTMWRDQAWQAVWRNPVNGAEALYIASHAFAVDGMEADEGQALIDELIAFSTQARYVYSHQWRPGDVLMWDERATLHRGRPWPYDEPRTLASICITVTDRDGLAEMRAGQAAA